MSKIVLTFGLISGCILAALMAVNITMCMNGTMDFESSEVAGYTSMILAFLLVFFGIRSYRENIGGGTITFGKAFRVGIFITLITCSMYVITWEILYFNFIPDFADKFTAHLLDKMRAKGASEAVIEAEKVKMARFKELYANPFINAGVTFLEVFPVGLIVTLVSAGILRRRPPATQAEAMA